MNTVGKILFCVLVLLIPRTALRVCSGDDAPQSPLSILDFGAKPAAGNDDTAAIQAAFDAAASQGKDVYLPTGTYALSRTVVFRAHGRTVYGDGLDRTFVTGNTSSYNLLQLDRTRDVTVRDLRFEGSHLNTSDTANTGKAVECYGTQRSRLLRIYAYGTGYIAFDNGGVDTTLEDSVCEDYGRIGYLINDGGTVRRCRFQNRDGWRFTSEMQGIYASAGRENILIEDCEFINVGIYAIQLWGSQNGVYTENVTIQRNKFVRCPRVLVCAAGDSGPIYRNIKFVGNTIQGTTEKSLHIGKYNGSTSNGTELLIEGNVFEDAGPGYGIFLTPWGGAALQGIRIRNNEFRAPNRSSYNGFVHVAGAKDVIIEGNQFSGIGHDGDAEIESCGVDLKEGTRIIIRTNRFRYWQTAGQKRNAVGVRFNSAVRDAQLDDNDFSGNSQPNCYGIRVLGSGDAKAGQIRKNRFKGAVFAPGEIPASENTTR